MEGSRIVTPARMCASLSRTRMLHSAAASCDRSLMPSKRPSSSKATAVTMRPSSRASRTRSVRYSSPVATDGVRAAIRRRSHAASNTYRPALISFPASSSGSASRASTIRSTVPNSLRTTRPSSAGSAAKTLARAIAASSSRRASRIASRSDAGHQRHVAGQHEDLGRLVRDDRERGTHRVPGPARLILESEDRAIGEDIDERGDGRREDHDRAATGGAVLGARPGVEDVGQHRPTAQRWRTLGVPDRIRVPRPAASTTADVPEVSVMPASGSGLGGFTRGGAVGRRSSGGCRARGRRGPARSGQQSSVGRRIVGVAHRGCQPTRATTSISTRAPFGRAATPTVERAGGGSVTNRP